MTPLDRERAAIAAVTAALLLCGALAWIAIIALGGLLIAALVAIGGCTAGAFAAWWVHTINDREARAWLRLWRGEARGELPRATARERARR